MDRRHERATADRPAASTNALNLWTRVCRLEREVARLWFFICLLGLWLAALALWSVFRAE